jgi:single-stranded DNA-binding protein
MSARALVSGVLFKAPASKVSKSGKPYVLLTIREGAGDAARWWRCIIFGSACEEALRLADGEPIAVAGEFSCESYAPARGESRLSWEIRADAVLSARRAQASAPSTSGTFIDSHGIEWNQG